MPVRRTVHAVHDQSRSWAEGAPGSRGWWAATGDVGDQVLPADVPLFLLRPREEVFVSLVGSRLEPEVVDRLVRFYAFCKWEIVG